MFKETYNTICDDNLTQEKINTNRHRQGYYLPPYTYLDKKIKGLIIELLDHFLTNNKQLDGYYWFYEEEKSLKYRKIYFMIYLNIKIDNKRYVKSIEEKTFLMYLTNSIGTDDVCVNNFQFKLFLEEEINKIKRMNQENESQIYLTYENVDHILKKYKDKMAQYKILFDYSISFDCDPSEGRIWNEVNLSITHPNCDLPYPEKIIYSEMESHKEPSKYFNKFNGHLIYVFMRHIKMISEKVTTQNSENNEVIKEVINDYIDRLFIKNNLKK